MKRKFTLLQAKRLVQIANSQTNLNLDQHIERDNIIKTIKETEEYSKYEKQVKERVDSYQERLKKEFDDRNKKKENANKLKNKKSKNKAMSEADIDYQKRIGEIKKELNQEVADLDTINKDIICVELDLPSWFIIPWEEYFMYFKERSAN